MIDFLLNFNIKKFFSLIWEEKKLSVEINYFKIGISFEKTENYFKKKFKIFKKKRKLKFN